MINSLTKECLNKFSEELKKPENEKQLHDTFLRPALQFSFTQLKPFFLTILVLLAASLLMNVFVTFHIARYFNRQNTLMKQFVPVNTPPPF